MSLKREKTPLEIEADNLVKDDELFDDSTSDDESTQYDSVLKKDKRVGESVFDFLERQTKE